MNSKADRKSKSFPRLYSPIIAVSICDIAELSKLNVRIFPFTDTRVECEFSRDTPKNNGLISIYGKALESLSNSY